MKLHTMDLKGMVDGCRLSLQVFGHRGSRWVVDASAVEKTTDKATDLPFFPIAGVFTNPRATFLGFGGPNTFMVTPRPDNHPKGPGWNKFAAFMFWRRESLVANTKGRVQAGMLIELCDLPDEALKAIRRSMEKSAGKRTASCANANAKMLMAAGFTCGGRSMRQIFRPSKLAARIWTRGLEYQGTPVPLRIIQTDKTVIDHFWNVWLKELWSKCRTIKKKYLHQGNTPAPLFEKADYSEISTTHWDKSPQLVTAGISRPSFLGAHAAMVIGEHPVFEATLAEPIHDLELETPLPPFQGKLNLVTKLKKYVLFSPLTIWLLNRHIVAEFEHYGNVPSRAVVDMLRLSPSADSKTAFLYNVVITRQRILLSRLENRNGRDHTVINWLLAKHLMMSNYAKDVIFAGQLWCYQDQATGQRVVCYDDESGSYKPEKSRGQAIGNYLSVIFGVTTRYFPHQ